MISEKMMLKAALSQLLNAVSLSSFFNKIEMPDAITSAIAEARVVLNAIPDDADPARGAVNTLVADDEPGGYLTTTAKDDVQDLLFLLDDAIEDLELSGRHKDSGYVKLKTFYPRLEALLKPTAKSDPEALAAVLNNVLKGAGLSLGVTTHEGGSENKLLGKITGVHVCDGKLALTASESEPLRGIGVADALWSHIETLSAQCESFAGSMKDLRQRLNESIPANSYVHAGWQFRRVDAEEGPGIWQYADDRPTVLENRDDYDVRKVFASLNPKLRKGLVWNGEGLPPIGCDVEFDVASVEKVAVGTVTGYSCRPALSGDPHLHRVDIHLVYKGTDIPNCRRLCDVRPVGVDAHE